MELTTRCPQCDTAFPVSLEQLQLRKGYIRCIRCAHIFDGFEAAVLAEPDRRTGNRAAETPVIEPTIPPVTHDTPLDAPSDETGETGQGAVAAPFVIPSPDRFRIDEPTPQQPFSIGERGALPAEPQPPSVLRGRTDMRAAAPVAPSFTISDTRPSPAGGRSEPDFAVGGIGAARPAVRIETAPRAARVETAPSAPEAEADTDDYLFIEPRAGRRPGDRQADYFGGASRARAWMAPVWAVLALLGLVVLILQGMYVYRAQLANAFPALRPVLETACGHLGCDVPYERYIDAIAITGSALRSNAAPKDDVSTLTLEVTLRNVHARPQEWPTLVLDLKDASGSVVVRRNLVPAAWVPAELRDGPFAADSEITVQVPVSVRGLQANGYQLDKFFP